MNNLYFVTKNVHYTENLKCVFNISVLYEKTYKSVLYNTICMRKHTIDSRTINKCIL
jgi:hypothetical protein